MLSAPSRVAQLIALALTAAAVIAVLFVPTYQIETSSSDHGASHFIMNALVVNGPGMLVPLAIPLVFAAAPVVARGRAWRPVSIAAAVLLALFTAVALFSMGVFLVPAAIAEVVALFLPAGARPRAAA